MTNDVIEMTTFSDAKRGEMEDDALRSLIRSAPLPMAVFGRDGRLIESSPSWFQLISPTDANISVLRRALESGREQFDRCLLGATETTTPVWLVGPDAAPLCVRMRLGPWRNRDGQVVGVMSHAWDATQAELNERQVKRSQERLTAALAMDRMVIKEIDLKTGETFISGDSPILRDVAEMQGDSQDYVHPEDRARIAELIRISRRDYTPTRLEYRHNSPEPMWLSTVSRTFLDETGAPDRLLLVTQDVTERVLQRSEVEKVAYTDALTGLPNRAAFQVEFAKAVAEADANGTRLGLIMVDVDHFKEINDTLGHDAGDVLLRELARHMRQVFRATDVVARLGGDEFAILLKEVMAEGDLARPLAALQEALTTPIEYRGQGFSIRTSMGAALHDDPDGDPGHLLKNADIALYKAKAGGRNQVVMFKSDMRSEVERRLELFRDIRAAIPLGEFVLFYQPVVNTQLGIVEGFEALMRWNHPDQGILPPFHFMAAFDDQDLALQLGEVTINGALKQMRQWMDEGVEFGRVSINLSAAQFRSGRLARDLKAKLKAWRVPAERLTVEVTENVSMGWGADIVSQTVRELHSQGITIALDDFGTGYASLANLRQFPIDRLKIDKSFVQNREDDAIVRAVINLGASMGMEVVAEGVERIEQLQALTRYGCDHIQGYHFSRPMPASDVAGYLNGFNIADCLGDAA